MQREASELTNMLKTLLKMEHIQLVDSWKQGDQTTLMLCMGDVPVSYTFQRDLIVHEGFHLDLSTKSSEYSKFFSGSWALFAQVETVEFLNMLRFLSSTLETYAHEFAQFSGNIYALAEGREVCFICSDGYRLLRFDMKSLKAPAQHVLVFQCLHLLWLTKLENLLDTIEIHRSNEADELGLIMANTSTNERLMLRVPMSSHVLPNGHRIMPKPEEYLTFVTSDLLDGVAYILILTKVEENHVIHCYVRQEEGKIVVKSTSEAGQAEAVVNLKGSQVNNFTEFKCNGRFLLEALKAFDKDDVIRLCFHKKYPILQIKSDKKSYTISLLQEYK